MNERTNYFFGFIFISVHKNMDNYEKIALVLVVFFSSHEKIVVARKSSKTAFPIFRCLRIYAGTGKTLADVKNRIRHERFSLYPMQFFPVRTDAVQARSRKINDEKNEKIVSCISCMNERIIFSVWFLFRCTKIWTIMRKLRSFSWYFFRLMKK